jgi:hypothetical protein
LWLLSSASYAQTDLLLELTQSSVSESIVTQSQKSSLAERPSKSVAIKSKRQASSGFKPSFSARGIRLRKEALKGIGKTQKLRIQMPDSRFVEGTVAARWKVQANGNAVDNTQIDLPKGEGFIHIASTPGVRTELLFLQVENQKVFRAELDEQGLGILYEEDPNVYFCVNHPTLELGNNAAEAPYSPEVAALIPPIADLQNLQSKPGASKTLFVNYWGGTLQGSAWNSDFNGIYLPFDTDGNSSSFSENERFLMWLGWREAAEDFASFDINITTSQSVYDSTAIVNRSQIIASPTNFYNAGILGCLQ